MRVYPKSSAPRPRVQVLPIKGWPKGLNTLTNPNQIRNDELAEAINVAYTQYGALKPRKGSSLIINLGSSIQGMCVYNKKNNDGSVTKYFLAVANGKLYIIDPINKTKSIQNAYTFSTTKRVVIVQGLTAVYFFDGINPIVKWDGTNFSTFTQISAPSGLAVTKTGTGTGTTTYSYIVTASNDVGETVGSAAVQLTSMPGKLDTSTYANLTWSAVTNAKTYNIYRGTPGNETYLTSTPNTAFTDQGDSDAVQSILILVPQDNTTGGPILTTGEVYHGSIMGVDAQDKSRVWYSAGGDKIDSFSPGDGGGWFRYHPETGEDVNGLKVFAGLGKDYCYIFQDHKIGQFSFGTNGESLISDVNLSVGGASDLSITLFENDLGFWSRYGAYTLRMEPNLVNVLRISELSIRVHPTYVEPITQSAVNKVCGIYNKSNHILLWSIPSGSNVNNTSLAFDPVYLGFSEYRGIAANCFINFVDNNENEFSYAGDDSGNIIKLFDGSSDRGEPIYFKASTKSFDMDAPYGYKRFKRKWFIFGNINVNRLSVSLIQDGNTLLKTFNISSGIGQTGWGVDFWDTQLWDETSGTPININTRLAQKYVDINRDIFSLQTIYENNEADSNFEILGEYTIWTPSNKPPPSEMRIL